MASNNATVITNSNGQAIGFSDGTTIQQANANGPTSHMAPVTPVTDATVAQNQADALKLGIKIPGVTPSKSSDGAVSSNDMMTGAASGAAASGAASSLSQGGNSGDNTDNSGTPSWATQLLSGMQSSYDQYNTLNSKIYSSISANYDASLAQNNAQYADLFNQLATQHTNEVQAGAARAAALNPYASANGASTSEQFTSALNDKYAIAYQGLTAKMQAAQQALAAGEQDSYNNLAKSAADEASSFQNNIASFTQNFVKMQQDQSNSDRNYNLSLSEKGQGDFNTLMTQLSGSPQLQSEIDTYNKTGKITPGLQPIIDKGAQAGMAPDEALSVFAYQTQGVRNQAALEDYRNNQQILAEERIANAQINANVKIATMQGLQQTSSALIASGKQPGTPEYALGLASATVGSKQTLPAASVGTYTNIGIMASQLDGLKSGVQSLDKNSDIWNIVNTYAGHTASSMTDANLSIVNSKIQALSGILGKSVFGESGNLSNSDISRILGNLPNGGTSSQVRDALYNNIVSTLADKAAITLQNDAANGYNVSSYAPIVQSIVDKAGSSSIDTSGGNTYKGFTLPYAS